MGSASCGSGLSVEMFRMWTSDYDSQKTGGKEYKGNSKKGRDVENTKYIVEKKNRKEKIKNILKKLDRYAIICFRDILVFNLSLLLANAGGQKTKRR